MRPARLCLLLLLSASGALAAPAQLRLSVIDDPRTTMGVAWTTPDDVASVVEVRPAGSSAAAQRITGAAASNVTGIGYVHTVVVTGLTAGGAFDYRVGDGAADWSAWKTFRTGPGTCDAWSFIGVGDDRADPIINAGKGVSPKWGPIAEEAAGGTPAPMLFINSGDLVYDGTVAAQWADWLTQSEPVTSIIPHMPVLGNHDAKGTENAYIFNDVFFLPRNNVLQSEDFYSFRYGNALFIAFTTASNDQPSATDARPFAQQAEWMRGVLDQNRDAVWRIVYLHHPLFTSGGAGFLSFTLGHPPDEKQQNEVLLPLLDEFHVDFVIAGHNHWYERFEAVRQGTTTTEGVPAAGPDDGTQHFITGGAGAVTLDFSIGSFNPIDLICNHAQPGQVQCTGEHHYVRFDIQGHHISVKTHATACQNDNCTHAPVVIDEFSYTKGGADPCGGGTSSSSSGPASAGRASSSANAPATSTPATTTSSGTAAGTSAPVPVSAGPTSGTHTVGTDGGAGADAPPRTCGCHSAEATEPAWALAALLVVFGALTRQRVRSARTAAR